MLTPDEPTDATGEEPDLDPATSALAAALIELDRHCQAEGWDVPPRLFALVPTEEILRDSPEVAQEFGITESVPGAWTAIEQTDFVTDDLLESLQQVQWPEAVKGCALALERSFLPAAAEEDLPEDPEQAQAFVENHPDRQDLRLVVGVTRAGAAYGVGRLSSSPEDLLGGPELAPGLTSLLATTLA